MRNERHAKLAVEWAEKTTGVTQYSRATTSADDGVGKKAAAQGFSERVFVPIWAAEGELSNAKAVARLKRDASRKKILAAVLFPPMATWGADSCRGSNDHKADAPWGTEATRDSQAKELNTITKSLCMDGQSCHILHSSFLKYLQCGRCPKSHSQS